MAAITTAAKVAAKAAGETKAGMETAEMATGVVMAAAAAVVVVVVEVVAAAISR